MSLKILSLRPLFMTRVAVFLLLLLVSVGVFYLGFTMIRGLGLFRPVHTQGAVGEPHYINPLWASLNPVDEGLAQKIYQGLLDYDQKYQLVPALAESWTVSADKKEYQIKLDSNQYWHDGVPVTIDDAVFTYQLIAAPEYNGVLKSYFQNVTINKQDEQTLVFVLPEANPLFAHRLTLGILPKHIWQGLSLSEMKKSERNLKPVGSGPYRFVSIETQSSPREKIRSVTLEKDGSFFRYMYYENEEETLTALKLGELDEAILLNPRALEEVADWHNFNISQETLPAETIALIFNLAGNSLWQDRGARQMLDQALVREQFIGQPSRNLFPSEHWLYWSVPLFSSDEQVEAQKRLKELADKQFTIVFLDKANLSFQADILARQFQAWGIQVDLKPVDKDEYRQILDERSFEVLLVHQELDAPFDLYPYFHSSQIEKPGLNVSQINDRRLDKALVDLRKAENEELQKQAYLDVQRLLASELPIIPIVHPYLIVVEKRKGVGA